MDNMLSSGIANDRKTLVELQFLPSVYYLAMISLHGSYQIEQWENYNKGSFRNKCLINSNEKDQFLIVPLQKGKHRSQPIRDVKISYDADWIRPMMNRLQTEFGGLPYYAYYIEDLHHIILKEWTFLFDLNSHLLEYVIDKMAIQRLSYTTHYQSEVGSGVMDLRDRINPRYFKEYPGLLAPVEVEYFTFVPGHSIIECLFMYGPETELVIRKYREHVKTQRGFLF